MSTRAPVRVLRTRWLGAVVFLALVLVGACANAQTDEDRKVFRVCQDPNNMPFSNTKGEGYEDKIAQLFAKSLGMQVQYYSFPQRMAFIRNTLRYKLPGEDYPCDIVMSVPAGFEQVLSTKPYYRSTYALVLPKGKGMDDVKSGEDFLALPPDKLHSLRIGIYDRSPASAWLAKHNLIDQGVPYRMLNADPDQYPGDIIEKDLANGKIDVALVWGPIAGYFAKRVAQPQLLVVPLKSEAGVQFDYQIAMGVRFGEVAWKKKIDDLIDSDRPQIDAILTEFGVPQVGAPGEANH